MLIVTSMNFMATHVFREGTVCADTLAFIGSSLTHLKIWLSALNCIQSPLARNRTGMPEYRFVNF